MSANRVDGPVRIVGTGLLGTSIGLVLRRLGVDVSLVDASPTAVALAVEYGAGHKATAADTPALVVVAVPPDVAAAVIAEQLAQFPDSVVTDVSSVKGSIVAELESLGVDASRYVGSHPMAGRERGGATAARVDLFTGRSWVVCARDENPLSAVEEVVDLALACGATVVEMTVDDHDAAVALVSHVPQVVSSVVAGTLTNADAEFVGIAGGGLRDVTRVAASDPTMWIQILSANSARVAPLVRSIGEHLTAIADSLDSGSPTATLAETLASGNSGVSRLPGKHGNSDRFAQVLVIIDDRPGQLARLLTDIGELGVNMEDLRLEHSPGAQIGFAEVSVIPDAEDKLVTALEARGWRIAGEAS
jgi:prephenate dehydrogenase